MANIETHCQADEAAVAALTEQQRTQFSAWMTRLDAAHEKHGSPYGHRPLARVTGLECWLSWFLDGDEPEDALAEDLSCAD